MLSGLDKVLVELIEAHPSIIVGTCDKALVPCLARAYGARILPGSACLELIVSRWPGPETEANVHASGRIAATFTSPETFVSYQLKGQARVLGACDPSDVAFSATYTETIRARIISLREPTDLVTVLLTPQGLFKVHMEPEAVFLQTPGKNAGMRL
jgi:hypothetical protein